jgi:hypothetical protein
VPPFFSFLFILIFFLLLVLKLPGLDDMGRDGDVGGDIDVGNGGDVVTLSSSSATLLA